MATRTAGLDEQIDELDHLLDQLLKLPIDKVRTSSRSTSTPNVRLVEADLEDDPVPDSGILPFAGIQPDNEHIVKTELDPVAGQDHSVSEPVESLTIPTLPEILPHAEAFPIAPSQSTTAEPLPQSDAKLPADEIPWIEDEPLGHRANSGPAVEIIVGPTCDVIVAPSEHTEKALTEKAIHRSWLYWLFWFITWCFDQTLGYWFPWLRRPGVKFFLGLAGVVLFAVSIYLAWIGWRR